MRIGGLREYSLSQSEKVKAGATTEAMRTCGLRELSLSLSEKVNAGANTAKYMSASR